MKSEDVVNLWKELRLVVDSVEVDVYKSAYGNSSAGIRTRHGLRALKQKASELVKRTREIGQQAKSERRVRRSTPAE